jgi:hypothetical protein
VSRRARGPLVVEFVGLPGAGKSAVATRLVAGMEARGVSWGDRKAVAMSEAQRWGYFPRLGLFFVRHPRELRAALRLASNGSLPDSATLYRAMRYLYVWSYRFAIARRRGYQVLLLEQGPVQDTWSLMLRGSWPSETLQAAVSQVILAAGLPYALISFEVTAAAAAKRIALRPTMESRFDHVEQAEAARQLAVEGPRLEQLVAGVVERTGAEWRRVDANGPLEDTCGAVEELIGGWLRPAAQPNLARTR